VRLLCAAALALTLCTSATRARAEPACPTTPPPQDAEAFEDSLIPRPLKHAKWAALVDGGWSVLMTGAWIYSARLWDTPQPDGLLGLVAARVLFGTSHSLILSGQLALFTRLFEHDSERLSQGRFQNEWWVGLDVPADCAQSSDPGCGFGLGGASELSVLVDQHLELALMGGWIQGRVQDSEAGTVLEATWFEGPLVARRLDRFEVGPVRIETAMGGGLFLGLHVAQYHPRGGRPEGASPLELSVLGGGLGPGFSGRLRVSLPADFRVYAEADVVPLFGHSRAAAPQRLAPLSSEAGVPIWRRFAIGLGFPPIGDAPVRLSARLVTMELSARRWHQTGHWMASLGFEVPFVLDPPENAPAIPPTCRTLSEKSAH